MKSLKHIISYACDRKCSYCINKKLTEVEPIASFDDISHAYWQLSQRHPDPYKHLMITGGEPTLNLHKLRACIKLARAYFDKVSLITANPQAINGTVSHLCLDDILFSIHDADGFIPTVGINTPVYASMVARNYRDWMPKYLMQAGYRGLSIREEYPDGKPYSELIPTYANFSVHYTRKQDCIKGEFLLPDFKLVDGREAFSV